MLPHESPLFLAAAAQEPGAIWIVKPPASSQGRGIYVTDDVGEIETVGLEDNVYVSRYVDNPLLLEGGLKFDLRIYVAVTSFHPALRIYMYEEGLVRIATHKFARRRNVISRTRR